MTSEDKYSGHSAALVVSLAVENDALDQDSVGPLPAGCGRPRPRCEIAQPVDHARGLRFGMHLL